jgi:hypothetical protein
VTTYDGTILDQGGAIFNVKSSAYGATGNGTTDDTAAIASAITAASVEGGIVYFPAGTYLISSTLQVLHAGVRLVGASRDSTTINLGSSMTTGDGVQLLAAYCGAEELTFTTTATRTDGAYISNSDGTHIGEFAIISKCVFLGGWDCIRGEGNTTTQNQDLFVLDCNFNTWLNVGIKLGPTYQISNIYISRCELTVPSGTQPPNGILIEWAHGVYISQVDIFRAGFGINIQPPTTETATAIFLDQVQCDSSQHNGLAINSGFTTNPGEVHGVFASNSWFQGAGDGSLAYCGAQVGYYNVVSGVQFTGCQFLNCGAEGLKFSQYTTQAAVSGCLVGGNGTQTASAGISINGGTSSTCRDIIVSGTVVGPIAAWHTNAQTYGLVLNAPLQRVALTGNSLSNNTSGSYATPLPSGVTATGNV